MPSMASAETIAEPVALLQGLDKITARVSKFEAPVGTPVQFGTLSIRVRDCEKNPPEETPESAAFLEIDEQRAGGGQGAPVQRLDVRLEPGAIGARAPRLRREFARLQDGERVPAGAVGQHRGEEGAVGECLGEQPMIAGAGDLDAAKARQMGCEELGIEQAIAAEAQPGGQVDEGDLARVVLSAEHAFAKKGRTERDAVQPADQRAVPPALDAVRRPAAE